MFRFTPNCCCGEYQCGDHFGPQQIGPTASPAGMPSYYSGLTSLYGDYRDKGYQFIAKLTQPYFPDVDYTAQMNNGYYQSNGSVASNIVTSGDWTFGHYINCKETRFYRYRLEAAIQPWDYMYLDNPVILPSYTPNHDRDGYLIVFDVTFPSNNTNFDPKPYFYLNTQQPSIGWNGVNKNVNYYSFDQSNYPHFNRIVNTIYSGYDLFDTPTWSMSEMGYVYNCFTGAILDYLSQQGIYGWGTGGSNNDFEIHSQSSIWYDDDSSYTINNRPYNFNAREPWAYAYTENPTYVTQRIWSDVNVTSDSVPILNIHDYENIPYITDTAINNREYKVRLVLDNQDVWHGLTYQMALRIANAIALSPTIGITRNTYSITDYGANSESSPDFHPWMYEFLFDGVFGSWEPVGIYIIYDFITEQYIDPHYGLQ